MYIVCKTLSDALKLMSKIETTINEKGFISKFEVLSCLKDFPFSLGSDESYWKKIGWSSMEGISFEPLDNKDPAKYRIKFPKPSPEPFKKGKKIDSENREPVKTNDEVITRLLKRIEELEKRVSKLEASKTSQESRYRSIWDEVFGG